MTTPVGGGRRPPLLYVLPKFMNTKHLHIQKIGAQGQSYQNTPIRKEEGAIVHEHTHGPKKYTQTNSWVNSVWADHRRKYPFLIGLAIYVCVTCVYSFACAPWR